MFGKLQFHLKHFKMQSRVIIALAVLSMANAAPSDPAPTEAGGVPLPESDRTHLCKFLVSFDAFRMGFFAVIMSINMDFMSKAEQGFPNEFKELFMNRRRERNETQSLWQRKFGVDKEQIKLILQNETVAQEWAKDHVFESHYLDMHVSLFNAIHSISKHLVEKATKMKSSLSEETVAREHELFDDINQFDNSRKSGPRPLTDLMDSLESKFKNKYQCST
ncbi:uncharacterized protein LOC111066914 [Drosophila obscura]|uniref:uncharacterized protein LOC111066914 n=1 Tax=Drosophila obscura TaxID=7282 RepID=UPI001BB17211|nr:uncharacterized protein LOC111066914 [Drosophila obscura]